MDRADADRAEQGTLMGILVRAIGAKSAVEVGVFTGYSSLSSRARSRRRQAVCCDVNEEWTSVARRYWERAGVASKITLRLAPRSRNAARAARIAHLRFRFHRRRQDQLLIYYEEILKRLRPSGLILIDNVLWSGAVIDESKNDADTQALRAINDFIATDTRVEAVMLGIADGMTIVRKK